jgi:hypothetical protein
MQPSVPFPANEEMSMTQATFEIRETTTIIEVRNNELMITI